MARAVALSKRNAPFFRSALQRRLVIHELADALELLRMEPPEVEFAPAKGTAIRARLATSKVASLMEVCWELETGYGFVVAQSWVFSALLDELALTVTSVEPHLMLKQGKEKGLRDSARDTERRRKGQQVWRTFYWSF
eukprot:jgi/Phyca11/21911/fgenesh1_pg.PHYCAscaffold_212_\